MKFRDLVVFFEKVEATPKRLEMTAILAELFQKLDEKEKNAIDEVIYLCQGQLLPSFKNIEFGISEKLIHKAIMAAAGVSEKEVKKELRIFGDYGEVAQHLCKEHAHSLSISEVYECLKEIALFSGDGSVSKKVETLSKLLQDISSLEAKYTVRIILGKMRLGIGDPTVLDGLSLAYAADKSLRLKLERAYNLCFDLGLVAKMLFSKGPKYIEEFEVIVGCPVRMALAARLSSTEEIIEKIGVCAVEAKYDGFRCQVHKRGNHVQIFSRNLENTTHMFPEIIEGALEQIKIKDVIFEGEALAYNPKTGECFSFQTTVQRKRKYDIDKMKESFPLKLFIFDLLYAGKDLTPYPYEQRREVLKGIIKPGKVLEVSPSVKVKTAEELSDIFEEALAEGREGIVAKRLDGEYKAGGRNFNWIKLKRSYSGSLQDTIDCVIVGYFYGKGLRSSFGIGSVLVCVYDGKNNRYRTIAKLGSGLSEDELRRMKKRLNGIQVPEKPKQVDSLIVPDVWVGPKFVIEVQADEITKSPVHTCGKISEDYPGFALRFPRSVSFIRDDKNAEDATSEEEIIQMFMMQGRRK
ncbi:MAG: ATP-dependent DNA ligase [Candidatus Omnitrophica bacterium]|nr:ATP-dependent DNA ligase [Candidatus Omnitrophota bacterium]